MFIRMKKTKTTSVIQLVSSYRDADGSPRQRIILSLGSVDLPEELWRPVIAELENMLNGTPALIPAAKDVRKWSEILLKELQQSNKYNAGTAGLDLPKEVLVVPESVSSETVRELGPELAAKRAFEALEIDKMLEELGFSPVQRRDTALLLINKLCEAVSEHALPEWINTTALEDLYGERFSDLGDDRFHRVADKLLSVKDQLEEKLSAHEQTIFSLDRSIYLYDLTNTYFEGVMKGNELAKRGHSKEKRSDAPLVSCGMVLDREGFVVKHSIYSGNIGETKTLKKVAAELKKEGEILPLIIMDSGIASAENLEILKENGFDYITVGKRPGRLAYSEIFEDLSTFRTISDRPEKEAIQIKTIETADEKLVACISVARGEKEKAILSNSEEKYIKDLRKFEQNIVSGKIKDVVKINRRIGRLEAKHHRISRYYEVSYSEKLGFLSWECKDAAYQKAIGMSGGYILKTSRKTLSDEEIWHLYIMLTKVESGFRTLKSELGLRPIYHQKKERCEAHIFITILAYHLLHWIEATLKRQGKSMSWGSVRRVLRTHSYVTIVLPTKQHGTIRIRKPSAAEVFQQELYALLDISCNKLPVTKMIVQS